MNQEKNRHFFSNEDLLNDDIMMLVADIIQTDADMEMLGYEQKDIPIRDAFDREMLMKARRLDNERNNRKKKNSFRSLFRIVAVFLVCVISFGAITMGTSEAFRKKVIDIFYNESNGSATLRNGDEEEFIGDWENFWYPAFLPEGFFLISAEAGDHFLLFSNPEKEMEFYIFEQDKNASISVDTDFTQIEKLQIGYSDGYLFKREDMESFIVTWRTESHSMMACFDGAWEKNQILEIIENLEYIKRFKSNL